MCDVNFTEYHAVFSILIKHTRSNFSTIVKRLKDFKCYSDSEVVTRKIKGEYERIAIIKLSETIQAVGDMARSQCLARCQESSKSN